MRPSSAAASAVRFGPVPLPVVVQSLAESFVIPPRTSVGRLRRINLRQRRAMRRRGRRRRRPRRDAAATRGGRGGRRIVRLRPGEVDGAVFDVFDVFDVGVFDDFNLDVRLVVLLAVAGVQVGARRVVVVDQDDGRRRRTIGRVGSAAASCVAPATKIPVRRDVTVTVTVRGQTQRENSREPRRHASPHRGRSRLALVTRQVSARGGAGGVRTLNLRVQLLFQPQRSAPTSKLLALREGQVEYRRCVGAGDDARGDEVVRHALPPVLDGLVRELLRGEQPALSSEAVGSRAVADVAAHRAPPLGIRERLVDVFAHAHLQAPPAPRAAASAPRRRLAPPRALTRSLDVGGFLPAKVARRALGAPGGVNVFAPHLAPPPVPAPRTPTAVEAIVMLGGVVLLSAVLALLRLSEPRELGADLARVDPGHHARGSAPAVVAAVARGRGAGGGGGCGRGCVARAEDIVDVAAEDRAFLLVHLRPRRRPGHPRVVLGRVEIRCGRRRRGRPPRVGQDRGSELRVLEVARVVLGRVGFGRVQVGAHIGAPGRHGD